MQDFRDNSITKVFKQHTGLITVRDGGVGWGDDGGGGGGDARCRSRIRVITRILRHHNIPSGFCGQ